MPEPFTITATSNSIPLDPHRQGDTSFTVFNASGRPIRGQALLRSEDPAAEAWLSIAGEVERDFEIAAAQQMTVRIAVPPDAPAGLYPFRLDMVGTENPDEDYSRGPTVAFAVPEPEAEPEKTPFPWWIVAATAGVLVVGGIIAAILLWPRNTHVPRVRGFTIAEATEEIEDARLQVASETREAFSDEIAEGLVVGTEPSAREEVRRRTEVTLIVSSEKNAFDVILIDAGNSRVPAIRVVRELTGLNLQASLDLVDNAPSTILTGVSLDVAENAKAELEAVGASADIE